MAHSIYTTTQTRQDRVFKETGRRSHPQGERGRLASSRAIGRRSLPQGERQESGAGALILRESGAGWRPLTSLGPNFFLSLLSPHWHSCRRPPDPAGRRQKVFAESSKAPLLLCVAPPASLSSSETRLFYWPIRHKISTWRQTPALITTSAPMSSLPIW